MSELQESLVRGQTILLLNRNFNRQYICKRILKRFKRCLRDYFDNTFDEILINEKVTLKKLSNAKMVNLIGNQIEPYRKNLELGKNEFFFDYLKKEIKEKRKMGHITILV